MSKTDAHYITVAGERLPLIAKKHPRARSLVVRYDARTRSVKVTCPRYVALKTALEFAASKEAWLAKQIDKTTPIRLEDGAVLSLFGRQVKLMHIGGRSVTALEGDALYVTGAVESFVRRARDCITKEMQKTITEMAARHAEKIGVQDKLKRIILRDTSSHWGSCNGRGVLSICVRLAFAPIEVLDYIVAHEVAHLKHHNHSAVYWQAVEMLCPEFEAHERWLKRHGKELICAW